MDNKTGPEIGTTAAAVKSCVSVLSAVTGQREETMERWLDLYYQVRRAHERAKEAIEAEAYLIEGLSLEPPVLMPAVPDDRGERRAPENASVAKENRPPKTSPPPAEKQKPTGGAGKPRPSQVGNTHGADAAAYKRDVRDKLLDLRKNGVSAAQIAEAGRGTGYTEGDIYAILEGKKIGVTVYRAIDAALGRLAGCIGQEK